MPKQYTKDELWKLFEKLPDELKEAVFAQETADHIFSICERNEINNVSQVAYNVGLVLMGALLPSDFQKTIEQDLGLEEAAAKSAAAEINRFIFYPVRPALEQLHSIAAAGSASAAPAQPASPAGRPTQEQSPAAQEAAQPTPTRSDTYREQIE